MEEKRIILTVDVEDYYMSPESIPESAWEGYEDRIEVGMGRLLDLLASTGRVATFFFLGWIAERHPVLVRRTAEAGHEIATHTYDHRPVYRLKPEEFRESLRRSIGILTGATGEEVVSHRAPEFSLRRSERWMWDILAEEGIRYDSSVNPVVTYLYGERGAPTVPYSIPAAPHPIVEVPPSAIEVFGKRLPVPGGGILRALPLAYTRWAIRRFNRDGHPTVVYVHPWEFDPDHPRPALRGKEKWIHNIGVAGTFRKLKSILERYETVKLGEYAREAGEAPSPSGKREPVSSKRWG
jgi:polysaccharide deacetylase family protein (PEP-CTERM system associated)